MNAMKKLLAAALVLLSLPAFAAPMTEEEFTRYYLKEAQATLKDVTLSIVRPLQLKSKDAAGGEGTTFLTNAYTQYIHNPEALQSIVANQLATAQTQKASMAIKDVGAIFAVIKPADYLENAKRQMAAAGVKPGELPLVYEKLNDDLYVFYVFDSPTGMRMVTGKDMADDRLELPAMRGIAVRNMTQYFDKKGVRFNRLKTEGSAKIYLVSLDENYEASILLLDKFWDKRNFDVAGEMVAFFPARNMVLVTGADDREGLRLAAYAAGRGYKELGYAISPRPYVRQAGEWKRFAP